MLEKAIIFEIAEPFITSWFVTAIIKLIQGSCLSLHFVSKPHKPSEWPGEAEKRFLA